MLWYFSDQTQCSFGNTNDWLFSASTALNWIRIQQFLLFCDVTHRQLFASLVDHQMTENRLSLQWEHPAVVHCSNVWCHLLHFSEQKVRPMSRHQQNWFLQQQKRVWPPAKTCDPFVVNPELTNLKRWIWLQRKTKTHNDTTITRFAERIVFN